MGNLSQMPKPEPPAFEVRQIRGFFAVVDATGAVVSNTYWREQDAIGAMTKLLKASRLVTRPCITCRKDFESEGPHNRMCPSCRNSRGELHQEVRPYIARGL